MAPRILGYLTLSASLGCAGAGKGGTTGAADLDVSGHGGTTGAAGNGSGRHDRHGRHDRDGRHRHERHHRDDRRRGHDRHRRHERHRRHHRRGGHDRHAAARRRTSTRGPTPSASRPRTRSRPRSRRCICSSIARAASSRPRRPGTFFTCAPPVAAGASAASGRARCGSDSARSSATTQAARCLPVFDSVPIGDINNYTAIAATYNALGPLLPYGSKADTPAVAGHPDGQVGAGGRHRGTGQKYMLFVTDSETDFCDDGERALPGGRGDIPDSGHVRRRSHGTLVIGLPRRRSIDLAGAFSRTSPTPAPGRPVAAPAGMRRRDPHDIYYQCTGVAAAGADDLGPRPAHRHGGHPRDLRNDGGDGPKSYTPDSTTQTDARSISISAALAGVKSCTFDLGDVNGKSIKVDLTKLAQAHILIEGTQHPAGRHQRLEHGLADASSCSTARPARPGACPTTTTSISSSPAAPSSSSDPDEKALPRSSPSSRSARLHRGRQAGRDRNRRHRLRRARQLGRRFHRQRGRAARPGTGGGRPATRAAARTRSVGPDAACATESTGAMPVPLDLYFDDGQLEVDARHDRRRHRASGPRSARP